MTAIIILLNVLTILILSIVVNLMVRQFQRKMSYFHAENRKQWNALCDITKDDTVKLQQVHQRMREN